MAIDVDVSVPRSPAIPSAFQFHTMSDLCSMFTFDFEEEQPVQEPEKAPEPSTSQFEIDCSRRRLTSLLNVDVGEFASRLRWDVQSFKRPLTRANNTVDILLLATRLSSVGYQVTIRTAIGGGDACFRNLHHQFLCVKTIEEGQLVEHIVEPSFRSNFQVARPTPLYAELLLSLPDEFVGPSSCLVPLVKFLCSEMAKSFKETGDALPPWRRVTSMLSKWLPAKSTDQPAGRQAGDSSSEEEGADEELSDQMFGRQSSYENRSGSAKSLLSEGLSSRSKPALTQPRLTHTTSAMVPPMYKGQPTIYKVKSAFVLTR